MGIQAVNLNVNELIKHFKGFALGPINLQIEQGTVMGLVGPNGSGKSTLLRLIMQLLQPNEGEIEVCGHNMKVDEANNKQNIGYAGSGLLHGFGHLTVRQLAALTSYWYASWDQQRYEQLLQRYNISEEQTYAKCSTGTQKKIEFIFALTHRPQLLLLDEPTAGVDMISQRKMGEDLIQYMEDERNSILMATHMMADVKRICDYICVLNKGQVIDIFDKDEINHRWARLWLSEFPRHLDLVNDPQVHAVDGDLMHIVTDDSPIIEEKLAKEGIIVKHREPIALDEAIEYMVNRHDRVTIA